jgi:dienelactone hydrolase
MRVLVLGRVLVIGAVLLGLSCIPGRAKIVTETVDYQDASGAPLQGYAVYDDSISGRRPAVIVIHDWRGLTDYTKMRAEMLAKLGYVAFAADIYGKGVHLTAIPDWKTAVAKYKGDRALYRQRARAAFEACAKLPQVDPQKIAAIGYCFGGTGVIEMLRDGLDLRGVVTFHGGLDARPLSPGATMKASVLALCGADDPTVSDADMAAFEKQLKDAGVDYEIVKYGHAVHAFTDEQVDQLNLPGARYNAEADHRSWQAMVDFLREIFARN